jgi:YD repeat-containing protein
MARLRGAVPPADHYRFTCEGGTLVRVERRDGTGTLEGDETTGVATEVYAREAGGRIVVRRSDVAGRLLDTVTLTPRDGGHERTEVDEPHREAPAGALAVAPAPPHVERLRTDEGRVVERRAFTSGGAPLAAFDHGVFGYRYVYDPQGNLTEETPLGPDGAPTPDARGVAARRLARGTAGFVVEESLHGADGALVPDSTGAAVIVYERDHAGNVVRSTRLDERRAPKPTTDGVVTVRTTRDPRGHAVLEETLDATGQPAGGFLGIAKARMRYDEAGRLVRREQLGADDRPVADGTGIWAQGWDYASDPAAPRLRFFVTSGEETDRKGKPLTRPAN